MPPPDRFQRHKDNDGGPIHHNSSGWQQSAGTLDRLLVSQPSSSATSGLTTPKQTSVPGQTPSHPLNLETAPIPVTFRLGVRKTARIGWTGIQSLLDVLGKSTGIFAPLKEVVDKLDGLRDFYEEIGTGCKEYEILQNELEGLFEDLSWHLSGPVPQTMTASMENLCNEIEEELQKVEQKYFQSQIGQDARRRNWEASDDSNEVLASYRRVQSCMRRLTLNADFSIWKIVDERATNALLDRLGPVLASRYNSAESMALKRGRCTQGTRVEVLIQMNSWVYASLAGAVYWLNGMAGTGKTTIAYSLCEGLNTTNRLGASFFCSRLLPECRDVNKIVPSIAYQLARFSRPFRCALLEVLQSDCDIHKCLLRIQFERLILEPLAKVQETLPTDLVVVIDALDECDNKDSTRQILDLLLTKSWNLPVKFFICSRPEPQIRDEMMLQDSMRASARLVLHELDKGIVQADIGTYLREALRPMQPSESQLAGLVERAGVLFIYAATAVRYIGYDNFRKNPHHRLETILMASSSTRSNKDKEIDELYTMILEAAIDDPFLDEWDRDDMIQVLHTVVCTREPLTIGALSELLELHDAERVHSALRPLWSVLHVMETSEPVTTLHASFPDYMFDSKRSKGYYCNETRQNGSLARFCFDCIGRTQPKFNLCGLESSYVYDEQVAGLDERIKQAISTELFYACRYWAIHLDYAESSLVLAERVEEFLSRHFLLWMEVLNLKKHIHIAADILWRAEAWSRRKNCSVELIELTHDAWRCVMTFASSPASRSTPHIYISMLPFWSQSAPLVKFYVERMQGMITPQGTAMVDRHLSWLASWPFTDKVQAATFSPDGTQIAVAAGIKLHVVDASTGQSLIDPLEGHAKTITSVHFSPEGSRVVSGSEDKTIRVWDPQIGRLLVGPLRGHSHKVTCVKFSPDGTRIASGSCDHTIRIWDVQNKPTMLGSFEGHANHVTSVGFSLDGTRIVSGSSDRSIRIWDIQSRQSLLKLQGHSGTVTSVEFSPDNSYIVSSSDDKTIRLWNARSGGRIGIPLVGHTSRVTSVAFSTDGYRIVSGSDDNTIRVWDPRTGETVLGPLKWHSSTVNSVAFSSQGSHLVSSSSDMSVALWDASTSSSRDGHGGPQSHGGPNRPGRILPDSTHAVFGSHHDDAHVHDKHITNPVLGPPAGHHHSITSVSFSSDGTRIVSGSADKTLRVWDARSAKSVIGPLEGHTNSVSAVAFSCDGTRIVSGSADKTILIWDAQNGQPVPGPHQESAETLTSATLSSIDTHTGSTPDPGNTIILGPSQNIQFSEPKLNPLKKHTGIVTSVAFSVDGARIVSGSADKTILVWDVKTRGTVLGPLEGHTKSVRSVGFSPRGGRIISGSDDNTIRVWDSISGQLLGPLNGHTGSVISAAFSGDGSHILSGSADKTVIMWDGQNGQIALGPLEGHTGSITSVAFSPNGTRIASSSMDKTIRVWDTETGNTVVGPLEGHTGPITSIAFSPDGTHIVSGSDDNTINVWDVREYGSYDTIRSLDASHPTSISGGSLWNMREDGWIVGKDSELVMWVPRDMQDALAPPGVVLQISTRAYVSLNFESALLGNLWTGCYCTG